MTLVHGVRVIVFSCLYGLLFYPLLTAMGGLLSYYVCVGMTEVLKISHQSFNIN